MSLWVVVVLTYGNSVYLMGEVEERRNPEEQLLEESLDPLDGRSARPIDVVDQLNWALRGNIPHHQTSCDKRLSIPVEIHQAVVRYDSSSLSNLVEVDMYLERAEEVLKVL